MVIALCIIGVLLVCSLILNLILWGAIGRLMEIALKDLINNPKLMLDEYYEKEVEEQFPCHLLLSIQEGADFDGSVYDFSQYEENKIISLTEFRKIITNKMHIDENEEPMAVLLPNQMVCKMKDGSYQWDIRPHI